ncbi:POX domain [Dillenia turbinata]|uniref:POX domain n=1 Tax=Dillenia turbinata TaxID=194707 RepID=A0AAN8VPN2_9MAGN
MRDGAIACDADERLQMEEVKDCVELQSTYYGDGHAVVKSETSSSPSCLTRVKKYILIYLNFHPKYIKASQELLNEAVDVQKVLEYPRLDRHQKVPGYGQDSPGPRQIGVVNGPFAGFEWAADNSSTGLSPAEQHELQNKMAKLLSMLDEIDSRYKDYCQHM